MTKKLYSNTITTGDIKKRHPRYLTCETDKQYAELAKDIYDLLYDDLSFMDERQIKHASISLALYFEDIHSNTHLFETFTKFYKELFGRYVPFYSSENADSTLGRIDAMKFMLWHAIAAEPISIWKKTTSRFLPLLLSLERRMPQQPLPYYTISLDKGRLSIIYARMSMKC